MPLPPEFDRLCVVLVRTRNPLNLGAAARAMSNFGFSRLRAVAPYDPAFREARSAVGASAILAGASEYKNVAEAVADCTLVVGTTAARDRQLQHPLRRLEAGAKIIRKQLALSRVGLLFGSEKRGLSSDDLSHCHWLLRIPTVEEHGSMNLGQAVAVTLYELVRASSQSSSGKRKPASKPASADDLERLTTTLLDALFASGYVKAGAGASTEMKARRLIRRLNFEEADAQVWLGMLRQIRWKLKSE
ncbi:MAG TPA: TrmH family RNA methyltransferase [Terriglobales bacterium]|nr:TrmH family RNA methyltransferase [Terriglobales bacterium]